MFLVTQFIHTKLLRPHLFFLFTFMKCLRQATSVLSPLILGWHLKVLKGVIESVIHWLSGVSKHSLAKQVSVGRRRVSGWKRVVKFRGGDGWDMGRWSRLGVSEMQSILWGCHTRWWGLSVPELLLRGRGWGCWEVETANPRTITLTTICVSLYCFAVCMCIRTLEGQNW